MELELRKKAYCLHPIIRLNSILFLPKLREQSAAFADAADRGETVVRA